MRLDGEGPVALDGLTELRTLDLTLAPVDDAVMATIGKLAKLRILELPSTDAELTPLASLSLESLGYFAGTLSPAQLDAIASIASLRRLRVTNATVPKLDALATLSQLEVLDVRDSTIDATALDTLRRLPKLRYLYSRKTKFGAAECAELAPTVTCDLTTIF